MRHPPGIIATAFDPTAFLIPIFLAVATAMTLGFRVIGRKGVAMMGKAAGSRPRQVPWVVSCLSRGHCKLARLIQRTSKS